MIMERVITVEYLQPSMSRDLLCKFPDSSAFDFNYTESGIWSPLLPRGRNPQSPALCMELSDGRPIFSPQKLRKVKGKMIKKKTKRNVAKKSSDFSPISSPRKGWRWMLRATAKRFKSQRRSSLQMMLPTL